MSYFTSLLTSLVYRFHEVTSLAVLRKHVAITDVFFPTGMVLSDASDIISGKKEAPTLVHLVAMSVNKETGDLEGSSDLHLQLLKRFISVCTFLYFFSTLYYTCFLALGSTEVNTCLITSSYHHQRAIRPSNRDTRSRDRAVQDLYRYFPSHPSDSAFICDFFLHVGMMCFECWVFAL